MNNTNLRLGKTDVKQLERMIRLAKEKGAILLENSDGHTFFEIGENDRVEELLKEMRVNGNDIFINRHDEVLDKFVEKRKRIRQEL